MGGSKDLRGKAFSEGRELGGIGMADSEVHVCVSI